jgi:hypothetical protein
LKHEAGQWSAACLEHAEGTERSAVKIDGTILYVLSFSTTQVEAIMSRFGRKAKSFSYNEADLRA